MSKTTMTLTLLAALAMAGVATAQDAPAAQDPATQTEETAAEPTEDAPAEDAATEAAPEGLDPNAIDLGEPIPEGQQEELQPGQPYIREVFTDWALRCIRAPEGPDPCQLYQLLNDTDGTSVAEVSIVPLPPGNDAVAGAVVVVPLETQLTEGLGISIDGSEPRRVPFDFCNRAGCVARFGMVAEQIDQMKRGAAGTITIVPALAPDQRVELSMSLSGFTNGYNATTTLAEETGDGN